MKPLLPVLCVLLTTCVCSYWLFADDDGQPRRREANRPAIVEIEDELRRDFDEFDDDDRLDEDQEEKEEYDEEEFVRHFDRTIKQEFKLLGAEEQPELFVLCASQVFFIEHEHSEPNHEGGIRINGHVQPADDDGQRFFVAFEASSHHTDVNESFDANFTSEGSAILQLGKQVILTNLGDQRLAVTATVQE